MCPSESSHTDLGACLSSLLTCSSIRCVPVNRGALWRQHELI